jgi:hypothetical protein
LRFLVRSAAKEEEDAFLDDADDATLLRKTNFSKLLASFLASKLEASFLMGERREVERRATRRGGLGGLDDAAAGAESEIKQIFKRIKCLFHFAFNDKNYIRPCCVGEGSMSQWEE